MYRIRLLLKSKRQFFVYKDIHQVYSATEFALRSHAFPTHNIKVLTNFMASGLNNWKTIRKVVPNEYSTQKEIPPSFKTVRKCLMINLFRTKIVSTENSIAPLPQLIKLIPIIHSKRVRGREIRYLLIYSQFYKFEIHMPYLCGILLHQKNSSVYY